jgi:hypothetical protein
MLCFHLFLPSSLSSFAQLSPNSTTANFPSLYNQSSFTMSPYTTAPLLIRDRPYNYTVNSTEECTLTTCSILQAQYTYDPSLNGNAFLASFFSLLILFQIILGIYYRTIGFSIAMSCGLILEVIGYIGRVQMHFNPFIQQPFMMYVSLFSSFPSTKIQGEFSDFGAREQGINLRNNRPRLPHRSHLPLSIPNHSRVRHPPLASHTWHYCYLIHGVRLHFSPASSWRWCSGRNCE